ncbi:MAG: aquaporin [Candidatus Cloacimonadota bacterium]|nr:MAG: aquaporin [Candidatus Cloacimonadota bacterium]
MPTNEAILVGEIFGTAILILLGNGVVANVVLNKSKAQDSGWIVITTGWGLAVTMAVFITGWMSGAHLNPAVTAALYTTGAVTKAQLPYYFLGEFIGAFIGACLVFLFFYPHFKETEDKDLKLACFSTGPAIPNTLFNFLSELIGTAMLCIGVLGIFHANNGLASGVGPIAVGLLVFSIGLSLGGTTGYAINPARDLAPRLAHFLLPIPNKRDSDWSYAWIPVVAPLLGGVLGALLYTYILTFMK